MATRGLEPTGHVPLSDYDDEEGANADDKATNPEPTTGGQHPHRSGRDSLDEEDEVTPTDDDQRLLDGIDDDEPPPVADPDTSLALSRLTLQTVEMEPSSENDLALTLLPPNELSTTTTEAAQAASTFTEMMKGEHLRYSATRDGYVGIDNAPKADEYVGHDLSGGDYTPELVVDGSGVVRRATEKAARMMGRKGGHSPPRHGKEEDIQLEEEEEEEEEDSSEISASDEDGSWIAWFCGLRGNEFFCEVDEDYIQVSVNIFC
jgi:hypothetical protein